LRQGEKEGEKETEKRKVKNFCSPLELLKRKPEINEFKLVLFTDETEKMKERNAKLEEKINE